MDMGYLDREIYGLLRLDDRWIDVMLEDPDIDVGEGPWCGCCGAELDESGVCLDCYQFHD